jgi:hypothetical protein
MNEMNAEACLEDLENRIDAEVEDKLQSEWEAFIEGRFSGDIFSPRRAKKTPPILEWPDVSVNRAQVDLDAMVLQQYGACSGQIANGAGGLMTVRANYGTGIMASLFGAELFIMEEKLNTLQTTRPLGADATIKIIEDGVPDLEAGLGSKVFEAGKRFAEIAVAYPKIGKYVSIYHPDAQGPMDICEMLWGSDMFIDLIDRPDAVHKVLGVLTETYVRFLKEWDVVVGVNGKDWSGHWGMMQPGKIMIRTDSGMNLSPDVYDEFIRPYDQRLLGELGGGAVHFCGRGSHYIESCCSMDGLRAINLSQPEYNDMETIYSSTVDKGIKLLSLNKEAAEEALASGRDLRGCVHCG